MQKINQDKIMFDNRREMIKVIIENEFDGLIAEHRVDPILRKVLAIGALSCWNMHGFMNKTKVKEQSLGQEDAQSIYWAFRRTGLLKALDALVYDEHSWGWSFHDLDLLEPLIELVQRRVSTFEQTYHDKDAWGNLNILKLFLNRSESLNIVITNVPCTCTSCIRNNLWLAISERKNITAARKSIMKYLAENVTDEDVRRMYEII